MWLVRLYCSLFLLLPVVLAAPLSQWLLSAVTTRWSQHGSGASARVTWRQSMLLEGKHRYTGDGSEVAPTLEVLTRAEKSRPGDRWPYEFSSLTPEMVSGLDSSEDNKDVVFRSSEPQLGLDSPSSDLGRVEEHSAPSVSAFTSEHALEENKIQETSMRVVKFRYVTLFSREKEQSALASPFPELEDLFSFSESVDLNGCKGLSSIIVWISARPLRAWTAVFVLMFVLFILSVIIVETTTALANLVISTWKTRNSKGIRLDGAEQKLSAVLRLSMPIKPCKAEETGLWSDLPGYISPSWNGTAVYDYLNLIPFEFTTAPHRECPKSLFF
ncbi:hypothetical protein CIHG_02175 [Coccidioides immitis H538.4]|nr:hypothetical protein CIHG_02175 [Coccidioides immitis H538.4]